MLSRKQVYPRTAQRSNFTRNVEVSEISVGSEREKGKVMNNKEKADVKNRDGYVESENHSHMEL